MEPRLYLNNVVLTQRQVNEVLETIPTIISNNINLQVYSFQN